MLKDFVERRIEEENELVRNPHITFKKPSSSDEIINMYRTYGGIKRHMRALSPEKVEEYLEQGYAFAGAYFDKELAGIGVCKELPEGYPYFHLPKDEEKGKVFTLGGLYVKQNFQGLGLASKLSRILTNTAQDYATQSGDGVGIGYEVSYDNFGSLKILSQHGNFIGFYADSCFKEGLSIMLYKPFVEEAVAIDRPSIRVGTNEQTTKDNLQEGLSFISNQEGIGGFTNSMHILEDETAVFSCVLNRTPLTVPEHTFELVR